MTTPEVADCPAPEVHGNPFRYCPYCKWIEEPPPLPPTCTCTEHFGQLHWHQDCPDHRRCHETMRGVPIQCLLTEHHKGNHK